MLLEKQLKVSSGISDVSAHLSILGIFQIVEETVTELMSKLEIDGLIARRKYNAIWLFVKNRIKILKSVPWNNDNYKVVGFISSVARATMCIDVAVTDNTGELCVYSRLELCAIDTDSGRIRKVSSVGVDETNTQFQPLQPMTDIRFGQTDGVELAEIDRVRVRYTNLDFSKHTNNKEYIRFIMNTYTMSELENKRIKEIEARYLDQSFENDELTVYKGSFGNTDIVTVNKGGKPIVRCEIDFD